MAFRSISTQPTPGNPTITVTPPAGIVNGDILVAWFVSDAASTGVQWSSGFTEVTGSPLTSSKDGQTLRAATKKANSESGNYTFGNAAGDGVACIGGVACFSNRDGTLYLHKIATGANSTANTSPWTITSGTFSGGNTTGICDIILIAGSDTGDGGGTGVTHSTSSGFTKQADISDLHFLHTCFETKDDVAAGETGAYSLTGTLGGQTSGWDIFAIALLASSTPASTQIYGRRIGPGRHPALGLTNLESLTPKAYEPGPPVLPSIYIQEQPVRLGKFRFIMENVSRKNWAYVPAVVVPSLLPPLRTLMGVGI
jgi:hypothetical protein